MCWSKGRGLFNIKMTSYQYRKFHCGDKMILRSSYLHSGISYTGKMTSLYWIRPCPPWSTVAFVAFQTKQAMKYVWKYCSFQGIRSANFVPMHFGVVEGSLAWKVINSFWPSDAIWQHSFGSTLAQVTSCCLMAPNHYLNQWWLIISMVLSHSPEGNSTGNAQDINHWIFFKN